MKNQILFPFLLCLFFVIPTESLAKRKIKTFTRKWSVSVVNGYSFAVYPNRKGAPKQQSKQKRSFCLGGFGWPDAFFFFLFGNFPKHGLL